MQLLAPTACSKNWYFFQFLFVSGFFYSSKEGTHRDWTSGNINTLSIVLKLAARVVRIPEGTASEITTRCEVNTEKG